LNIEFDNYGLDTVKYFIVTFRKSFRVYKCLFLLLINS
jgi:hypothetical protein